MLFADVCAEFISSCHGECCFGSFFFFWEEGGRGGEVVSSWRFVHMGVGNGIFWAFLASFRCLAHMGGAGFASFSPHVYKTRVTEVCLSLDTPFGRWSVGAYSA